MALLVVSLLVFLVWFVRVVRRDRQQTHRHERRKEHLKYLEEYSVRTDEKDEKPADDTKAEKQHKDQTHLRQSRVEDWSLPGDSDNISVPGSNPSTLSRPARSVTSESSAATELATNIDDVKL